MSDPLVPAPIDHEQAPSATGSRDAQVPAWGTGTTRPELEPRDGIPWSRYLEALRRYKWLVLAIVAVGTTVGVMFSRSISKVYEARATIWVSSSADGRQQSGPIRPAELLESSSWVELLRSYAIADSVVEKLRLYITPADERDSPLFATFDHGPVLWPASYRLVVDSTGSSYELIGSNQAIIERGVVGDSVGRSLGFRWCPTRSELPPGSDVAFVISLPRDASQGLLGRLTTVLPEDGQFLSVTLKGANPQRTARILNTYTAQFVSTATDLKTHNLVEFRKILESQLGVAEQELHNAEMDLERFRVETITLPAESSPIAGGVEATRAPVLQSYFERKTEYETVRHDREQLEMLLARSAGRPVTPDALYALPGIVGASPSLKAALEELTTRRAELRSAQRTFTDAHPRVRELQAAVRVLETETIPQLTAAALANLRQREHDLASQIAGASRELRAIPTRSIEEMRLRRQVSVAETMYNTLKSRYEEARLAEAGATPDVSILDVAVAPQRPLSDRAPMYVLLAVGVSIGLATFLVILLDRIDPRFRYPEQATELGLGIIGAVPRIAGRRRASIDVMTSLVEAFRTLRLSVRHEWTAGTPTALTVTSPGMAEGKSLVAANLALAFANAGQSVALVDGDLRRGTLHVTFDLPRSPGLSEYLNGTHELEQVIQSTATKNLTVVSCGGAHARAPELLASERLARLMQALEQRYDVVITDAPPLLAGMDAYALGVATGHMLLVLRLGKCDRRLAEAKLQVVDRLPIRVMGAVVNEANSRGVYRYYGYSYHGPNSLTEGELSSLLAPAR